MFAESKAKKGLTARNYVAHYENKSVAAVVACCSEGLPAHPLRINSSGQGNVMASVPSSFVGRSSFLADDSLPPPLPPVAVEDAYVNKRIPGR